MTQNRQKLYNLENQYINNINQGICNDEIILKMNKVLLKISPDFQTKTFQSINDLLKIVSNISFSSSFLSEIVFIDQNELCNEITEEEIMIARQYVEQLLNVDLSSINIEYSKKPLLDNTEGQCIACEKDKHQVFYQNDEYGVISTDLIVHELGHAADFTISRSINDDKLLNRHISISESIAYYCQYKYLLENGTKEQRKGLFGAFIFTYLSIVICKYCLKNNIKLHNINQQNIILDESIQEIIKSYKGTVNDEFIKDKINMLQNTHANIISLLNNEVLPRFGMILALFLLNKDKKFIIELIQKNSIDHSFESFVSKIIPNEEDSIINIESEFEKFFDCQGGIL